MENVVLCSQDYTVAAAQSLSRSVLTPAEQVELICLGDACFLTMTAQRQRYSPCLLYTSSAVTEDPAGIMQYLENTFPGRLRSVCALTETAPSDTFRHPDLNTLVHCADIISVNLEQLLKDGIVEAIYAKDLRRTILDNPDFENIFPVSGIAEIKAAAADDPVDWHLCEKDEYLPYSPWAAIKHYFTVLANG